MWASITKRGMETLHLGEGVGERGGARPSTSAATPHAEGADSAGQHAGCCGHSHDAASSHQNGLAHRPGEQPTSSFTEEEEAEEQEAVGR